MASRGLGVNFKLRNVEVSHVVGNSLSRTVITAAVENLLSSSSSSQSRQQSHPRPQQQQSHPHQQRRGAHHGERTSSPPPPPPSPPIIHVLAVSGEDSRNLYSVVNAMDVCRELGVSPGHMVFEVRDQRLGQQVVRARRSIHTQQHVFAQLKA